MGGWAQKISVIILFLGSLAMAQAPSLDQARAYWQSGNSDKALATLTALLQQTGNDEETTALAQFLTGTIQLRLGQLEAARQALEKSLGLKSNLAAYAFFQLGDVYSKLGRFRDAKAALDRVGYFKPPAELRYQVRYQLGEIALQEKQYGDAERHFAFLERKWKRSAEYPEILWRHLRVALKRESRGTECKLAKRLYTQFPSHPLVYDWNLDLQNAQVEGHRLGCIANPSDQASRLRHLQLAGESDRARREVEQLRTSGNERDADRADMMLVQFLISDGFADDALKILLRLYPRYTSDTNFLLTLAKAASRAGEYQTAVGCYQRANELSGGSRAGREALFQAAFQSYQIQDYDGAARKFARFIEKYPRSGLTKDARWHLAWMRYLRGDYEGALNGFAGLQNEVRRSRRSVARTPDEKVTYWIAMSLARLGRAEEARQIFSSIQTRDPYSFYATAAQARLERLPKPAPPAAPVPAVEVPVRDLASVSATQGVAVPQQGPAASIEGGESEEAPPAEEAEAASEDGSDDTSGVEVGEETPVDTDDEEKIQVTEFKDPRLRRHFEIAKDLISVGLMDWAKQELYEVERRSRNPAYLKMLIKSYEGIQSYHRAVAISDTFFAGERTKMGFAGAKSLWETAYPKAYQNTVTRYADQFSLQPELIWSIMRAESHFKADVLSPVGARGLLQLMPETGRQVARILGDEGEFRPASLLNPETNIRLGARYLLRLSGKFKNSLPLIAAAYNGGPHRVETWIYNFGQLETDEFIEHIPYLETRNYVKKVVRNFAAYRGLYNNDRKFMTWLAEPLPFQLSGRPSTRESWD